MHYDRKSQDMGADNVYVYVSYDSNHTKSDVFSSKISMVTNVILILYNGSINKLISRDLHFIHYIACFCCILSTTKK